MIDLISDTVTRPTPAMLLAMQQAIVGDDVFKEDPTVHILESKCASIFGHEAGLFCPSGTMANQIALKVHTQPMDEVICDEMSHIFQYEVGGYAFHSGIGVNLLRGQHGIIDGEMVQSAIKPHYDWLPRTSLVVIENTCNKGGGSIYPLENMQSIRQVCLNNGLKLHLDGARIFNALAESSYTAEQVGELVDSISICLSKGLGAPVGSVLVGSKTFIATARRVRKALGGGMRQVGYLAAAGIFALDHHRERLVEDHHHARMLAAALAELPFVASIQPVATNICIFDLEKTIDPNVFLNYLSENGLRASGFGGQSIRFVTHLEISLKMIHHAIQILQNFKASK